MKSLQSFVNWGAAWCRASVNNSMRGSRSLRCGLYFEPLHLEDVMNVIERERKLRRSANLM